MARAVKEQAERKEFTPIEIYLKLLRNGDDETIARNTNRFYLDLLSAGVKEPMAKDVTYVVYSLRSGNYTSFNHISIPVSRIFKDESFDSKRCSQAFEQLKGLRCGGEEIIELDFRTRRRLSEVVKEVYYGDGEHNKS